MKFRLIYKLLIALFASTALVLLLILWVAQVNIGRGFEDYLAQQERALIPELAAELGSWYVARGSWSELKQNPRRFYQMLSSTVVDFRHSDQAQSPESDTSAADRPRRFPNRPSRQEGSDRRHGRLGPPRDEGSLHRRVFLLDHEHDAVIGHSSRHFPKDHLIPVEADGSVVGWLGVVRPLSMLAPTERAFVHRTKKVLLFGLLLGLGVAALLAWVLARHLGQPVSAAARGIRKLATGDYSVAVETRGSDEIAQLSHDVNRLAHSLSENRGARQRWMADMAHELRTPLSIIRGELESVSDGVRPLDETSLASIREEVNHLNTLVDDLHHLALSDSGALAYHMNSVNLAAILQTSLDSVHHRAEEKGIEVQVQLPEESLMVSGDDQRLRQLFRILLDNAVLYTDAPGVIEVSLGFEGSEIDLQINDSPPGVPEAECEQLFDRLYRRESSRNRNSGGSGLGLAIARNIAIAHGGSISASTSQLGGLSVQLKLPVLS